RGWEWFYWDRLCQGAMHTLKGHAGRVSHLAFSPDGSLLASAGGDPEPAIKLWDTVTGQEVRTLKLPKGPVHLIAFSPDGRVLASCEAAGVTFWGAATGQELRVLTPDGQGVFGPVAFSPDWKTLAVSVTEAGKPSIRFWDLRDQRWLGALPQTTVAKHLKYSP